MEKNSSTKQQWRKNWQQTFLFLMWFCNIHCATGFPVRKVLVQDKNVVMDNSIVKVTLSVPGGMVTGIRFHKGRIVGNLLDPLMKESRRGYWDMVWKRKKDQLRGIFEQIEGTSFRVITEDENRVELSFTKYYNPSIDLQGMNLPLTIDKRFVLLRGESGFYTYSIFERLKEWPDLDISEIRFALRLKDELFTYMAVSDTMQRRMPTGADRLKGVPLAYPEAVRITNPKDRRFKGEVDDKYQYSKENKDNHLHGWICPKFDIGIWMIIPSYEYRTGGPFKQELTSHVGPYTLAVFSSYHYSGNTPFTGLKFRKGEPWKKVFGPVFVYLNSNNNSSEKQDYRHLWSDAKDQMETEIKKWPYDFPASPDFPPANQRGTVTGRLLINDRYINRNLFPAKLGYIGLSQPGEEGSWQFDGKGYQFWTRTDEKGRFTITGIREGNYNLFGSVPGILGDYKYQSDIIIESGIHKQLGNIVFIPPRNGPTVWEIGIPDRTASEFYVPDALPGLKNHLFENEYNIKDKWRQYGLWDRYTDLYPHSDLEYKIGVSNYSRDWFYAHVNRRVSENFYIPTTWQISFDILPVVGNRKYILRIGLSSSNYIRLEIRINTGNLTVLPHFSTGRIGRDNAIARHGIHGLYSIFSFEIAGKWFVKGKNRIFLTQSQGGSSFNGHMYDYLRLEEVVGPIGA